MFLGAGLLLLSLSRGLLLVVYRDRLGSIAEWPLLFLTGLRFDLLTLCYLLAPAWVVMALLPAPLQRPGAAVLRVALAALLGAMVVAEFAAWPSLREFGSRPEGLFLEFLGHPREVARMLGGAFRIELLLAALLAAAGGWQMHRRLRPVPGVAWPIWRVRLVLFPIGAGLLFLGARSSFGHRPANLSTASFSQNHFHNEAALNSTYTLLYSAYRRKHEMAADHDYGFIGTAAMLALVEQASGWPPRDFVPEATAPTTHRQRATAGRPATPLNVVVIVLESLGAEYTGWLGGTRLTPNLDRLAEQGLAFDQLYATGTRTARGLEAVVAGFFPTPARSVLKLSRSQRDFFTAPALFRAAGYSTHFLYGGEANFDEMKSFFRGNGVDEIWDQPRLQKPGHATGAWGIHDEDLLQEADALFRAQRGPFFAVILSSSNHTPFDYPADRVALDPAYAPDSAENAIRYSDYALGRFFAQARASAYYSNTLFLVVADHGHRVIGSELIPLSKFHVPAVIIGPPDRVPREHIRCRASQVDLMPTLLGLTGREWVHPMLGRDLLAWAPAQRADPRQGRALLQYETHFGYWQQDNLLVLRPGLPPVQYRVGFSDSPEAFELVPVTVDPAFAAIAQAHSLLPAWLYRERLYRLAP